MKAGKVVKSLGMAAVALTLVSACMVGSTLAKYTTTLTGSGTAVVAKWAPKFTANSTEFVNGTTVTLSDTSIGINKLTSGSIAPGTDGNFAIEVAHDTDSDVAFRYTITISNMDKVPANLKFYTDSSFTTPLTETSSGSGVYEIVADDLLLGAGAETTTVYWQWGMGTTQAEDTADTEAGELAATATFDITCTATQIEPVA